MTQTMRSTMTTPVSAPVVLNDTALERTWTVTQWSVAASSDVSAYETTMKAVKNQSLVICRTSRRGGSPTTSQRMAWRTTSAPMTSSRWNAKTPPATESR
jgi:hypothetical protein